MDFKLNKKIEVSKIKQKLGEVLNGGKCFICEKSKAKKGFTVHHLKYIFNDIIYKNYPHDTDGQYRYYQDLEKVVMKEQERFMYLCNVDHVALERLNRYGAEKVVRLIKALIMTETNEKNKGKLIVLLREMLKEFD